MKIDKKTLKNILDRMIKTTSARLSHPAYGNYRPSRETFILALEVYFLKKEVG